MKHVLITQRHSPDKYGTLIDSLENTYTEYFSKFGIFLYPVSNVCENIRIIFETLKPEGIILSGGNDINPELYNEFAEGEILSLSRNRDKIETLILNEAIESKIPVLGICRGMQFINVYFGGSLTRDIPKLDTMQKHKSPGIHEIRITDKNLFPPLNYQSTHMVNSYHNHGILREMLSPALIEFAEIDELGLIEGIYHPSLPIIGIQWHPERQSDIMMIDRILINSFLNNQILSKIDT